MLTDNIILGDTVTRGIRNNNPLNLVKGLNFFGEIYNPKESKFATFEKTWQGVRAAVLDITTDISKGLNTVEKLINEFAPKSENDTKKYIDTVCKITGLKPDTIILKNDFNLFLKLIPAMIFVENGKDAKKVTTDDILEGIKAAFKYRGYKVPNGVFSNAKTAPLIVLGGLFFFVIFAFKLIK